MWSQNRQEAILTILEDHRQVSTGFLASELDMSRETIRRDIIALDEEGLLLRIHGGVKLLGPKPEEPFQARQNQNRQEKLAIAKAAANLIQPNQTIFIDAGTTTSIFAHELAKKSNISVVTNSYDIAAILYRARTGIRVVLLGGRVETDVPGTYGELTLSEIQTFQTDVAVISPVSLSASHGAGNYDLREAGVARAMITQSKKLIMLADQSKLESSSLVQICECSSIDTLVTNQAVPDGTIRDLRKSGISSIVCG